MGYLMDYVRFRLLVRVACCCLLAGLTAGLSAQTPTSLDIADLQQGDDPAIESRRLLARAQKALHKAEKQMEKGAPDAKVRKQLERALEEASQAANLDPLLSEAEVVEGRALLHLDRPEEAFESCSSAVRWAKELGDGHACQAIAAIRLGRPVEAMEIHARIVDGETPVEDADEAAGSVIEELEAWLAVHGETSPSGDRIRQWLAARR